MNCTNELFDFLARVNGENIILEWPLLASTTLLNSAIRSRLCPQLFAVD